MINKSPQGEKKKKNGSKGREKRKEGKEGDSGRKEGAKKNDTKAIGHSNEGNSVQQKEARKEKGEGRDGITPKESLSKIFSRAYINI